MNIAIGTTDGVSVCSHLARSSRFLLYEVRDGRIESCAVRERFQDACGNHGSFVDLLKGCRAVLCGGIGQGAADALAAHGIQAVVTAGPHTAEEAIELYLAGRLPVTTERICLCH